MMGRCSALIMATAAHCISTCCFMLGCGRGTVEWLPAQSGSELMKERGQLQEESPGQRLEEGRGYALPRPHV